MDQVDLQANTDIWDSEVSLKYLKWKYGIEEISEHTPGEGLVVKQSNIEKAGLGLFSTKKWKKGDILCLYMGTHLTLKQFLLLKDKDYTMGGFGLNCHIDAKPHLDVWARYINDNLDDQQAINCKFVKLKEQKMARVIATRDICPGEELYLKYGDVYWRGKIAKEERKNLAAAASIPTTNMSTLQISETAQVN